MSFNIINKLYKLNIQHQLKIFKVLHFFSMRPLLLIYGPKTN